MKLKITKQYRPMVGSVRFYVYKDDIIVGNEDTIDKALAVLNLIRNGVDKETLVH